MAVCEGLGPSVLTLKREQVGIGVQWALEATETNGMCSSLEPPEEG